MLYCRYIPPGTAFWVHAYSLHRDPSNFSPCAEGFWPERWLIASSHKASMSSAGVRSRRLSSPPLPDGFVHNEDAYMPFSHGPMNCVAKNFALMEMRIVICALMQRLTFRLRAGYDRDMFERGFKDYLVASRPELPVFVELRK